MAEIRRATGWTLILALMLLPLMAVGAALHDSDQRTAEDAAARVAALGEQSKANRRDIDAMAGLPERVARIEARLDLLLWLVGGAVSALIAACGAALTWGRNVDAHLGHLRASQHGIRNEVAALALARAVGRGE